MGGGFVGAAAETVVEYRLGLSGQPVNANFCPVDTTARPGLWVESDQGLGPPGTPPAQCPTPVGGVPAVNPPSFGPDQTITDALRAFAFRFLPFTTTAPCTFTDPSGLPKLVDPTPSEVYQQYCTKAENAFAYPLGTSVLSAQLQDGSGNLGPTAQVVVRVVTPGP